MTSYLRATVFLSAVILYLIFTGGCAHTNPASRQLQELFDDHWEFVMKEDPLFATHTGDNRFNDRLPSVAEQDIIRENEQNREFLERLKAIDRSKLTADEQLNYDIFKYKREDGLKWFEFNTYLMPVSQMGGFHTHFAELPDEVPLNNAWDYENYIARLNGFEAYARQHIDLMRMGIQRGYVVPRVVMTGVEKSIQAHIVNDPDKSLLFKPFEKFPEIIDEADRMRLTEAGRKAITQSVVPGYKAFLKFMVDEYIPAARQDIAASSLPHGRAFYEHCVRSETTLDVTPKLVHDIGLNEVKRIKAEMEKLIAECGFENDMNGFEKHLTSGDRRFVATPQELLKQASFVVKTADGSLPKLFRTLPRMTFGIKEVPDYLAPKTAMAYYMPSAGDGSRAGFFYINTHNLENKRLYTLTALSMHETVPGHHLQISLQQELKGVPNFRRFAHFTAFVEGWALYAEWLGLEIGMYGDPNSDFGRLTLEMWRACRLVVDTGIHYFGWSREQAIDYMVANIKMPRQEIEVEVDRYIVWPGQAIAYKMGELKIRELRNLAEKQLGDKFDVRQFHDCILRQGAVPLNVLESNVKTWIKRKRDGI
ncbi:MAG: DUF885 domain-containing protein [Sedimentisphaerales bacterium]|nr:DUF885 domain-containing protein [Sedimentisphaerales bacterium]